MKKILRSTLAIAVGLSLAACHSSNKNVEEITPSTLEIQGQGVKGVLSNATVNIYAAADTAFATVLATTQTDAAGNYTATVTDESGEPIVGAYVVSVVADEDTTMVCDAVMCGDVARGETVPAEELTGLTLSTFSFSDGSGAIDADVNTLTTMATDAIQAAAANNTGIDLSSVTLEEVITMQQDASQVVGAILGLDLSETNIYDVKIVDASVSADVSTDNVMAASLTLINASLSGLDTTAGETLADAISEYVDAIEEVATAVFAAEDPTNMDLGAIAAEALAVINETQAQIAEDVIDLKTDIVLDTGTEIIVEDMPSEVNPEDIADTIGDIIVGTGGTGGTGGSGTGS